MARGGIARLPTGNIKTDHSSVAVLHHEFSDLAALGRRPHRRQQRGDPDPGGAFPLLESIEHSINNLIQAQAAVGMQLGCEAHLGVDDPIGCQILGTLTCNAGQRLRCLRDTDGVLEGLEVALQ